MKKQIFALLTVIGGLDSRALLKEIQGIDSKEELAHFQSEQLKKLILHAYHHVSYYRPIFDKIQLVRNGEVDLSRYADVPLLTKEIIRQNSKTLVSDDYRKRRWFYDSSGGSTGEPVKFIQDNMYLRWGNASYGYWHKDILGIDEVSSKKVVLWGSIRDLQKWKEDFKSRLANWSKNTVFLNSYRMTEADIVKYIQTINRYKPDLVRGYSGSLYELCRYAQKKNIKLHSPQAVVSAADMLTPEMRKCIEEVFARKVFDFYGSREVNNLAGECKKGLLHILGFHNYIEVLDKDNRGVKEGEEGKVIITNLHNYSMPLIRYEIGDLARLGPQRCACGSILPTLQEIQGRIGEHFVKEDGTLISPHLFIYWIRQLEWVKEFQVVQKGYKDITLLIVPKGVVADSDKRRIEEKIRSLLGEECQVEWEFVREILRTPQGKYRYLMSLVHD